MKKGRIVVSTAAALALCVTGQAFAEWDAQVRLEELGYLRAEMREEVAIHNFQLANGLLATSVLDDQTAECLFGEDAVSQREYLTELFGKYGDAELAPGSVGGGVTGLQNALVLYGYLSDTDNAYGEKTRQAVAQFQLANGLNVTGNADADMLLRLYEGQPMTWDEFITRQRAERGDSGAHVKRLQNRLAELEYFEGVATGSYGDMTAKAVAQFQAANDMAETGAADFLTVQLLYSDGARARYGLEELRQGSAGAEVSALQQRLLALGYNAKDADGSFGIGTCTAVMLFQIANSLPVTGIADARTMEKVNAENAVPYAQLAEMPREVTEETRPGIAQTAVDMLGRQFVINDGSQFPGFEFAQYVCARNGIALTKPDDVLQGAHICDCAPEEVKEGALIVLEQNGTEGVSVRMGVCIGDGQMAYADETEGWVLGSSIAHMDYSEMYVCAFGDE